MVRVVVEEHPIASVTITVCVPEHNPEAMQAVPEGTELHVIPGLTHCIVYGGFELPEADAVPLASHKLWQETVLDETDTAIFTTRVMLKVTDALHPFASMTHKVWVPTHKLFTDKSEDK